MYLFIKLSVFMNFLVFYFFIIDNIHYFNLFIKNQFYAHLKIIFIILIINKHMFLLIHNPNNKII